MLKEIIDKGLFDKTALDLNADGFDDLAASLEAYEPDRIADLTGVDSDSIREAAKVYAEASKALIILTDGMNRMGINALAGRAAANLAVVTDRIGEESSGILALGEKTNSQGAVDMGLVPDLLPGFQSISDEQTRSKFEEVWQSSLPTESGMDAAEILEKAGTGEIKGLYIVGENPLETYPDRAGVENALGNVDFLVVQDMFSTSTAKMAHAVLPVAAFAEKRGTFTSAERLVQLLNPVLKASGAKTDLEIFCALAASMGKPTMTYAGPEQVMDEIAGLVDVYKGISYDRLVGHGLPWPCVDPEDPGQRVLYEGGFPGGKATLAPAPAIEERSDSALPMYLIPGALKFHSGTFSEWSFSLMDVCPEGFAEMAPEDLKEIGLEDGDMARITSESGSSIHVKVKRSRRPLAGTVIVPQHFSALKLNTLTRWEEPAVRVRVEKA